MRKNHKFDFHSSEIDKCSICGIYRKKSYLIYSGTLSKNIKYLYSEDGINFQKEFINCKNRNYV